MTGEMAPSVQRLLCNPEDLSLILCTHVKTPDAAICTSNPSAGKARTRGSLTVFPGGLAELASEL